MWVLLSRATRSHDCWFSLEAKHANKKEPLASTTGWFLLSSWASGPNWHSMTSWWKETPCSKAAKYIMVIGKSPGSKRAISQ